MVPDFYSGFRPVASLRLALLPIRAKHRLKSAFRLRFDLADICSTATDHQLQPKPRVSLRIMPLGGSITHGVGSSDGNGYRKELYDMLQSHGYVTRMVGSRKSGTMANNDHEGWRGFRIDQIENKARGSVKACLPNVFTVNAGSNDCIQNLEIENFGRRLGNLLEYLWLASPGSTIILSTLLVSQDKSVDSRIRFVNEQIRTLAASKAAKGEKITLVDMCTAEGPCVADLVDGVHPNDLGYRKMANLLFQGILGAVLKGLLEEPRTCE